MQDLLKKLEEVTSTIHLESYEELINLASKYDLKVQIESCFNYKDGWLFVGIDFNALESRIDALLTKDPMKLAVYVDGFDSHCLASFFYFREQMPDIEAELQGYFDD